MQVGEAVQGCRYAALQFVDGELELSQAAKVAERRGYFTAEVVVAEVHFLKAFQIAELIGYWASQVVAEEHESAEV